MEDYIYTSPLIPIDLHWLAERDIFTPKEIEIMNGTAKRVSYKQLEKLFDKLEKMGVKGREKVEREFNKAEVVRQTVEKVEEDKKRKKAALRS